jgi:hypothetical protein
MANYDSTKGFLQQQMKNYIDIRNANKILREATINTAAAIKRRVQQEGKKADGSPIKKDGYSTKPLKWVKITNKWGAVASQKRTEKRKAKYGADKYLYFPGGYKEFRKSLGRQVAHVDLTLSRDMFRSWRVVPIDKSQYGITFISDYGMEISYYHEKRFGLIFKPTTAEQDMALQTIVRKVQEFISR